MQYGCDVQISNLHSTMYLFQPASGCRIVFRHFGFTFHYVSISTCFPAYSASLFKIYIPLCIYFNSPWTSRLYIQRNLHSTMYLFQQAPAPARGWFSEFTFHYVSISTYHNSIWVLFYNYLHSTMYLFQLLPAAPSALLLPDLHSTMYLFQRFMTIGITRILKIYIPLCIYFNYPRRLLHPAGIYIYIPLCIYFNQRPPVVSARSSFIYIPLCIYFNLLWWIL